MLGRNGLTRGHIGLMVALFLVGMALGPARATAQTPFRFRAEYLIDRDTIEIPFEYKERQILVRGEADTLKDLTFVFDTGASAPVLDSALNVPGMRLPDSVAHEANGKSRVETIALDYLKLKGADGDVTARNLPALQTDLSQLTRVIGHKIDGILGVSFMAGFVTEIDYVHHVLRFHRPTEFNLLRQKPDSRRTFLFETNPADPHKPTGCQVVTGKLHPKYEYDFLLDTGFGGYVSVAYTSAQEAGIYQDSTPRIMTTSYTVSSQFRGAKIRARFLALGDIVLSGRVIQVDVRNDDAYGQIGIIGNRLLQNYRVILDYPHHLLWLDRATEKEEPDDAEKPSFGIAIVADGRRIAVDRMSKHSPSEAAGLREGDILVSINDMPVQELSVAHVANLLNGAREKTKFVMQRDKKVNAGLTTETYTVTIVPTSPLDWEAASVVR